MLMLQRIARHKMRLGGAAHCYRSSVVSGCVCRLDTTASEQWSLTALRPFAVSTAATCLPSSRTDTDRRGGRAQPG